MQMFEEEKILLKQQLAWFLLIKAEHEGVHGFVLFFFPHHCMLIDLKQMLVYTVRGVNCLFLTSRAAILISLAELRV